MPWALGAAAVLVAWPAAAAVATADLAWPVASVLAALAAIAGLLVVQTHRALARARVSEGLMASALDALPDARMITAPDGSAVSSNPAWAKLVGFDCRQPLAPLEEQVSCDADGLAGLDRLRDAARGGRRGDARLRVLTPAGASRWRAVSVSPLDGRPGYTLWGVADITRQHDMERMVHEEQDQLAEFLENAPIGFYSVDAEGRFLFVNETLASWLGHAPAEITGNRRALREFIAPPPRH